MRPPAGRQASPSCMPDPRQPPVAAIAVSWARRPPARIISSEARRASLTVLGRGSAHRRSITSRVIRRSGSPVSVVGSTDARDPLPPADRVIAILLPGQNSSSVLAVLDVAVTTARRHGWPMTVMADWSDAWKTGLAESILKMRAYMTGDVDLETRSLGCSSSPLPPVEAFTAAMVVLASPRRHRVETETRRALDRLLRIRRRRNDVHPAAPVGGHAVHKSFTLVHGRRSS